MGLRGGEEEEEEVGETRREREQQGRKAADRRSGKSGSRLGCEYRLTSIHTQPRIFLHSQSISAVPARAFCADHLHFGRGSSVSTPDATCPVQRHHHDEPVPALSSRRSHQAIAAGARARHISRPRTQCTGRRDLTLSRVPPRGHPDSRGRAGPTGRIPRQRRRCSSEGPARSSTSAIPRSVHSILRRRRRCCQPDCGIARSQTAGSTTPSVQVGALHG